MSSDELENFQSSYGESISNFESKDYVNMQVANEFQTPTEYFATDQESENGQLDENEVEYQLFAHELRDSDFEEMTLEMMQELESNFENYSQQQGVSGELETIINQSSFQNLVNGYFESSVGHLIPKIDQELNTFSNYVQTS